MLIRRKIRSTNGTTTVRPGRNVRLYLPNTVVTATVPWATVRRDITSRKTKMTMKTISAMAMVHDSSMCPTAAAYVRGACPDVDVGVRVTAGSAALFLPDRPVPAAGGQIVVAQPPVD